MVSQILLKRFNIFMGKTKYIKKKKKNALL